MNKVTTFIVWALLICSTIAAVGDFFFRQKTAKTLLRIEAKLDTVLTINLRTQYEINHEQKRLDTIYSVLSNRELVERAKQISDRYRTR